MLSSLFIRGFRGYGESGFSLSEDTAIIGTNGSGKTHILEALHIVSGGHLSYIQAPREREKVISFEIIHKSNIGNKSYSLTRHEGKDVYMIQGKKVTGVKYREELPYRTVFVSPFDMNLFYFAPSMRRDYIDSILARTFAQFSKVKRDYDESMRQRNALLKKIREGEAKRTDLPYWDRIFRGNAELYTLYRKKWGNFIEEHMDTIHSFLSKYNLSFHYTGSIAAHGGTEVLMEYLEENRERDILSGHTHIGPHLDDFGFLIDGSEESHLYLSRGENKVLLLALKQLEILFIRKHLSLPIVLLFDDIFAELDQEHAERVIETLDTDQVIMTTQRVLPKTEKWAHFACINLENQ